MLLHLLRLGGSRGGEELLDTLLAEDILKYQDILDHQFRVEIRPDELHVYVFEVIVIGACQVSRRNAERWSERSP